MSDPDNDALYRRRAAIYVERAEDNAMNALYERPAMRALVGPVAGLRVLDAGCAGGGHSAWLVAAGARVTGVDKSAEMVGLYRKRLGHAAIALQADLGRPLTALGDGAFDLVLCSLALHYLRDWLPPLRELRRVLVPGGRLCLSTHHPLFDLAASPTGDYARVELVQEQWRGFGPSPVPVQFWRRPLQRITDDLGEAGFVVQRLVEPTPSEQLDARAPDIAAFLRRGPAFLLLDARRA